MANGFLIIYSTVLILGRLTSLVQAEDGDIASLNKPAYSSTISVSTQNARKQLEAQYIHHFADEMEKNLHSTFPLVSWHAIQVLNGYKRETIASVCDAAYIIAHHLTSSRNPLEARFFKYQLQIGLLLLGSVEGKYATVWTDVLTCAPVGSKKFHLVKGRSANCVYFVKPKRRRAPEWIDGVSDFVLDANFSHDVQLSFKFTAAARWVGAKVQPHLVELMKQIDGVDILRMS